MVFHISQINSTKTALRLYIKKEPTPAGIYLGGAPL